MPLPNTIPSLHTHIPPVTHHPTVRPTDIGTRSDASKSDQVGASLRLKPSTGATKMIFESLSCDDAEAELTVCTRKCAQRLDISGEDKPFSEVEAGDVVRFVPASFKECDCGEGRGIFKSKSAALEVTFQESYGDRITEVSWDANTDKLSVELVSLYWTTGITCSALYAPYEEGVSTPTAKKGAHGGTIYIDYGAMIEDEDFKKLASDDSTPPSNLHPLLCGSFIFIIIISKDTDGMSRLPLHTCMGGCEHHISVSPLGIGSIASCHFMLTCAIYMTASYIPPGRYKDPADSKRC